MADEVEISNVGGPRGVASEATLAALVSALNRRDTNTDRGLKLEALARTRNVTVIQNQNKQGSLLGKTIGGLASSTGGLIKEFTVGGNRISDFSRAVFGANSLITGLTTFTDNLIDTFREMSTIGGSFNNSLFEFIKTSGLTGMSLTEFSNLVINNSTQLRMLSGSVSEGAARFGLISRELRRNFGSNLTRVGFTMSEMNEVLLDYTDFSISRMGRETRSNAQLAKSASIYALELDQLSRLTGISRQQLAETIKDQQADQRVRAATANMTDDQARRFNEALAVAGSASPVLKDAILDMADGIPDEDVTRRLMSVIPSFGKLSTEVENMSFEELAKFMRQTGQEIDQFSDMPGFQALIRNDAGFAGLADIGAGLRTYSDLTDEQIKKLLKEQGQRDRLSETLLNFENALNNLQSFILTEIIESPAFAALEQFGTSLADTFSRLFGDGSEASGAAGKASEGFKSLTETLIGSDGIITGWIESLKTTLNNFNAYIDAGGNPFEFFKEKIGDLAENIGNWFTNLFLGTKVTSRDRQETDREGGIFESIGNIFKDFWNNPITQNAINDFFVFMKDMFGQLVDMLSDVAREKLGGIAGSELSTNNVETLIKRLKAGETLTSEEYEDLTNTLNSQARTRTLEEKGSGFLGWRSGANALGELSGVAGDAFNLNQMTWSDKDYIEQYEELYGNARATPAEIIDPKGRAFGTLKTTGNTFEPKDAITQIHQGERVLNPQETQVYNNLNNIQSQLVKKVEELNTSMLKAVDLLQDSVNVARQTTRSIKSLGTDAMRGVGR